jgi:hypothetical protein
MEQGKKQLAASVVAPHAYESDSESENEDNEDHVDDLTYDIFNLVACDYHPVVVEGEKRENLLKESAMRATQLLVNRS